MKVYVVGDGSNPRVRTGFSDLMPWLEKRAQIVGTHETVGSPFDASEAELVVVLGGDGAILATAALLEGAPIPLIGIRVGHFGFLAELEPDNCRAHLDQIFAGHGRIVEREMLECEVRVRGASVLRDRALNDAVATAGVPGRIIALDLEVDGEKVATYRGDGLIVATPVGSTAHSLAAGGPVIEPAAHSFVVTPLAAHTLASRPLVLDSSRKIVLRRSGVRPASFAMTLDGQRVHQVESDAEVHLCRAATPLRMMTIVRRSFFATLRKKFNWGGSVALDRGNDRSSN